MRTRSCVSRFMRLLPLITAGLMAGCYRAEPDTNDTGPVASEGGVVERPNHYHPQPVVDYSQINTNHPEDPATIERLRSLGCWLTESDGVHKFMGYPHAGQRGRMSDDDFRLVKQLPNLMWLQLSQGYKQHLGLTSDAFRHLRQHPELRAVSISGSVGNLSLDDSLFEHLAEIPKLKELSVVQCQLKGNSLRKLAQAKGLKSLSLSSSRFEATDWSALSQLENLELLDLQMCNVGDDELRFISSLKNLRVLKLYGNGSVTRKSLPMLQELPPIGVADADTYWCPSGNAR